jgi:hypothetical protein
MSKENVGTVKWLDDGWHGWVNGQEFTSMGIWTVCDRVAACIPGDVEWEAKDNKTLICRPSTKVTKMSKHDQDEK